MLTQKIISDTLERNKLNHDLPVFAGAGKTYLSQKYPDIIDLESIISDMSLFK